jgi:arginine repressor
MSSKQKDKQHFYSTLISMDEIKNALIYEHAKEQNTRVTGAAVNGILDVFKILTIRTGRQTNKFEVSNNRLMELTGLKRLEYVSKTIAALSAWGFLAVAKRSRGDKPTVYILNPDLIWCGKRTKGTRHQIQTIDTATGEIMDGWRQNTIPHELLTKAKNDYIAAGGVPLGDGKGRFIRAYGKRFDKFTSVVLEM